VPFCDLKHRLAESADSRTVRGINLFRRISRADASRRMTTTYALWGQGCGCGAEQEAWNEQPEG